MKRILMAVAAVAVLVSATVYAAEKAEKSAKKDPLKGIKCVVNAKAAAKADKTVDYKGGKVYFCCAGCPKKFSGDVEKFATSANHQLVATGQAKQAKCPLSGGKLNPDTALKVGSASVKFCCNNCKGAVAKLEGDAQLEKVFGEAAFKKAGFAVANKK